MKDSKKYGAKVRKLYRELKRKYPKVEPVEYEEPAEAIVYALISEKMNESATRLAVKKFHEHFVDLNDLRVSRAEEIVELLGEDTAAARDAVLALTRALMAIFEKYNTVSLESLKKIGKRPAKQILEKINGITPFVVNYCMLTALYGHAIPLTEQMYEYLREKELVHPEADDHEIEGFLTRLISAETDYEFYYLIRHEGEKRIPKLRKKKEAAAKPKAKETTGKTAKSKKKTKKKTTRKKSKK
jgi:endonuclease III